MYTGLGLGLGDGGHWVRRLPSLSIKLNPSANLLDIFDKGTNSSGFCALTLTTLWTHHGQNITLKTEEKQSGDVMKR